VGDQTAGVCTLPRCDNDAECGKGHTCVASPGEPDGTCQAIGDPAFILAVPTEQFRDEYTFLAPNAYKEDYVNVVAPQSAVVTLDGEPLADGMFAGIPGSNFKVARLLIADGVHRIQSTEPVGATSYGYHDDVSYGYPAGANLFDLGK